MYRLLKLLVSRMAIVMVIILLQAFAYILLWSFLSGAYIYIHTFFSIISIVVLIAVINKQGSATYKLPWVFILLVMPFYGVIIYSLFGRVNISKKYIKLYTGIYEDAEQWQSNNEIIKNKINDKLIVSQSQYIYATSKLAAFDKSKVSYFPNGETYFESLVDKIKNAKKYIFLEYFIIEEGKMWNTILDILKEKVNQGVEVYLIYDDIGCISRVSSKYYRKLNSYGIKTVVFNPFVPIVSAIHNNRDHRKIAIIDGKYAFTGGINLADEYINEIHPFGKWKDSGVLLEGIAVASFMIMFIQTYNAHATEKLDYNKYLEDIESVDNDGFVQPYATGPKPFYNDNVGESVYLNMINQAKKYIYINTPYLIVDYHFILALKNASKRGVDVRIMTPHIPDKKTVYLMTRSNYSELIESGVKIYEYEPGFIHAKSMVCDDELAIVGTVNLDYRSFIHHFECGVWMYNCNCIKDIKEDFISTCEESGLLITIESAKLKFSQKILKNLLEIFSPLL